MRAKFLGSNGLFGFISICKFGSFKNLVTTITSLSEFYFRRRRFILLVQTKKVISVSLIWYFLWGIYTSIPTWIHSQNLLAAAETPSLKISPPWNISQMFTKTISISLRIFISYMMKRGILLWIWWKFNGNWDHSMIRISQWRESHSRTNTNIKKKSKRAGLWESKSGIQVGELTIWVRSFEIYYNRVHQVDQFHQNR